MLQNSPGFEVVELGQLRGVGAAVTLLDLVVETLGVGVLAGA